MLLKIDIHASMLPGAVQCERSAIARSYRKELTGWGWKLNDLRPHISGVIGGAFHSAVKYMLAVKKYDPEQPIVFDETARMVALLELKKGVSKHPDGVTMEDDGMARNLADAEKQLIEMLQVYTYHLNTLPAPAEVEVKLKLFLRPGIRAVGTPDWVTIDNIIRDHKTGGQLGWYMPQQGLYGLMRDSDEKPVDGIAIDFMQRLKHKRPKPISVVYDLNEAKKMAYSLVNRIADNMETFAVEQDPHVFNANPCAMFCSDTFCPAFKTEFCKAAG